MARITGKGGRKKTTEKREKNCIHWEIQKSGSAAERNRRKNRKLDSEKKTCTKMNETVREKINSKTNFDYTSEIFQEEENEEQNLFT